MLGSFAVGKTSLVKRFVHSIFSEKYHTTIGVKIDQKILKVDGAEVNLLIWDLHGEDDYQKVKTGYIMGASGCFIVMDGTRKATLDIGYELINTVNKTIPDSEILILINKSDCKNEWEISEEDIKQLKTSGFEVMETSAKANVAVELAFEKLAHLVIK